MPVEFFGKEFTFFQPDGTTLQVTGWGNQERAVFETREGFTIVKDPVTGFFQYAKVSDNGKDFLPTGYQAEMVNPRGLGLTPRLRTTGVGGGIPASMRSGLLSRQTRWETRREITRMRLRAAHVAGQEVGGPVGVAGKCRITVGDIMGLCLLVSFPDDVLPTIDKSEVESFCNDAGYHGFHNNGSVNDYFRDNSQSKLNYTNKVVDYYTAKKKRAYYTDANRPFGEGAQELLTEALDDLMTTGFDFSQLSVDNLGYVFATSIFYAGPIENNWLEGLWPHSSRLLKDYEVEPNIVVADYQITNMGDELTLGTFCHESGHLLCDFPDLYDPGRNNEPRSHGIGAFCLMCAGDSVDPKNPTQICAYLKYCAGWANVRPVVSGVNEVGAFVNEFLIHQKSNVEYFIIEVRDQTGRDAALPGSGLAIWHVDVLGNNENEQMAPNAHYECSLEQADGKFDFELIRHGAVSETAEVHYGQAKDLYPAEGNNTAFGDATTPDSKWWDGTPSGLEIFNISSVGNMAGFDA